AWVGRPLSGHAQPAPDDPSKVLGGPLRPYGDRSRFEQTVRAKSLHLTDEMGSNCTPLDRTLGIITPSALQYVVHRPGLPDIDVAARKLRHLVHGMVDRPVRPPMGELKRLPSPSGILFLECAGQTETEWRAPPRQSVRDTHGVTGCSEWPGVPLALLLREAGR